MRSFLSLPLSLALLSSVAIAQGSVVSPVPFTNAEAVSNNSYVFGVNTSPFRYMQIHDDLRGTPRLIKGITMRRNATSAGSLAWSVTVDVWCSTSVNASRSADPIFDNNHGTDKAKVITNKVINFPASPAGDVPADFLFDVPFDTAFSFVANGSLCVEVQKTAHTNAAAYFLDADNSSAPNTNPALAFASYGTGCRLASNTLSMTATGASAMNWPAAAGIIRVTGTNGPLNSFVVVFLGASNQHAFGTVPLPFLLPGSATAPSGPCNLYADTLLITASVTTATGTSTTDFAFPATPDLNGIRTFEQILAVDPAANPSGVVLSNGVNHNIVAPYGITPGARIYVLGSLNTVGTVGGFFLVVTRFNS